jgi:hypothetical protein
MQIGGAEVWTLWGDQPIGEPREYMFARLDLVGARHVRWAVLGGDEGSLTGKLDIDSLEVLARLLADRPKAVADLVIECRR